MRIDGKLLARISWVGAIAGVFYFSLPPMASRLIAHLIRKRQYDTTTTQVTRTALIQSTEASDSLLGDLRASFNRNSRQGAKFRVEGDEMAGMQEHLVNYFDSEKPEDEAFIEFTHDATRKLAGLMSDAPLSVGGYLVFAEYERAEEQYLLIVLLSSKARAQFDDQINLKEVATLDVDHIRHAARFKYSGVRENLPGTVQFVAKASEGNFFKDFIDCNPLTESRIQASLLKTALSTWATAENLNDNAKEELMKGTYGYWNGCRRSGTNMSLLGLANSIYPNDPGRFIQHLSDEGADLDGEFAPPAQKDMKQFRKFAFEGGGLKIEFDRSLWKEKFRVQGTNLLIRNAPEDLLRQLEEERS